MASQLRIPAPYKPGLEALASMDDETAGGLLEALREQTGLLSTERLAQHVGEDVPPLVDDAFEIVEALLSLITLLPEEGEGADELASDIAHSRDLDLDEPAREAFTQRLRPMLEIETLIVAARASDLVTEYERVFHDARILTDLRPVFGRDPAEGPKAAALIATLKVDFHPPTGRVDSEFYALEHSDLLRLRDVVNRAIAKHASMRKIMDELKLPYWEYQEGTDAVDD
jgi:hypothetical protein